MKRLVIVQESSFQLRTPNENNIVYLVPVNDVEFGIKEVNRLNSNAILSSVGRN